MKWKVAFFLRLMLFIAGSAQLLHAGEDLGDARRAEAVEDLLAAPLVEDEPGVAQHGKMVGDGGDVTADALGQLRDAEFAVAKGVHD